MATVSVANTTANLSGKTLAICEQVATITALWTFNRGASAPFAVNSGSAVVSNLDADKLDGSHLSELVLKTGSTMTGQLQVSAGTVSAPGLSVGDTDVGLYSSGTNALDITTAGVKALGVDSTQFIDSPTQPRAAAYNNGTQTVNAAANAVLTLDSELYDVGGCHSTSTNTERLTVPTGGDGLYLVQGFTHAAVTVNGTATISLRKNGTMVYQALQTMPNTTHTQPIVLQALMVLAAADYVDLHAASASTNIVYGGTFASGQMTRLEWVKLW